MGGEETFRPPPHSPLLIIVVYHLLSHELSELIELIRLM